MSFSSRFSPARAGVTGIRLRRRVRRVALSCESLETRRLLSTGAAVLATTAAAAAVARPFVQVLPMSSGTGSSGLSPQAVASAYGINSVSFSGVTGNGAGQTIAIVDAYNDPNIASDLAAFDRQYGLNSSFSFSVDNLGATTTDPGWAMETALDVEWAHAIAPDANIVLVEAPSASMSSLLGAATTAASLPGVSVVSMSWGSSESYGEWASSGAFNMPANHNHVTFVAASGDSGAASGPTFPSVSPNVLAVGGTSLSVGAGGTYQGETGWAGSTGGYSGTNSGYQYGFSMPSYQSAALTAAGLNVGVRTTPDVSFNADPSTGVAVYDSVSYSGQSGWFDVGGTSAAAPAWAGLVAITDQGLAAGGKGPLSTTQLLNNLYSLPSGDYHDVTSGFNGYQAGAGYDLVTGLGSPAASQLIPGLLAANGVSTVTAPPTTTTSGHTSPATTSPTAHNAAAVQSSAFPATAGSIASGTSIAPGQAAPTAISALLGSSTATVTSVVGSSASTPAVGLAPASTGGLGQGVTSRATPAIPDDLADDPAVSSSDVLQGASEEKTPAPSAAMPSPAPASPVPAPEPAPADDVEDAPAPPAPGRESVPPARDRVESALELLIAEQSAARLGRGARLEPARDDEGGTGDGPSLAGLVVAGAVGALGRRAVRTRVAGRRPATADFRSRIR
jgi:hypothetical protein